MFYVFIIFVFVFIEREINCLVQLLSNLHQFLAKRSNKNHASSSSRLNCFHPTSTSVVYNPCHVTSFLSINKRLQFIHVSTLMRYYTLDPTDRGTRFRSSQILHHFRLHPQHPRSSGSLCLF